MERFVVYGAGQTIPKAWRSDSASAAAAMMIAAMEMRVFLTVARALLICQRSISSKRRTTHILDE